METADLPLHFPLLSNSPSTPFPSVYTQARDDMAAASLVLGLNKNDDADLVAAAPEAAASWPQPVLPVAGAMLVQPTATAAAAVAAASAAVVAAASATPALPATALARPIFAAPAVAAPAYVAPAPMAAPAAAASSSYTTAAASASTTPPRASTFAAPSGLVKAVALGSLQVAPSNKENSCSDSPARGHGAGGASPGPSKVLTPSGNSPYRHNKSSSLRHSASADWEAGLEAALAIQALHAGR